MMNDHADLRSASVMTVIQIFCSLHVIIFRCHAAWLVLSNPVLSNVLFWLLKRLSEHWILHVFILRFTCFYWQIKYILFLWKIYVLTTTIYLIHIGRIAERRPPGLPLLAAANADAHAVAAIAAWSSSVRAAETTSHCNSTRAEFWWWRNEVDR